MRKRLGASDVGYWPSSNFCLWLHSWDRFKRVCEFQNVLAVQRLMHRKWAVTIRAQNPVRSQCGEANERERKERFGSRRQPPVQSCEANAEKSLLSKCLTKIIVFSCVVFFSLVNDGPFTAEHKAEDNSGWGRVVLACTTAASESCPHSFYNLSVHESSLTHFARRKTSFSVFCDALSSAPSCHLWLQKARMATIKMSKRQSTNRRVTFYPPPLKRETAKRSVQSMKLHQSTTQRGDASTTIPLL